MQDLNSYDKSIDLLMINSRLLLSVRKIVYSRGRRLCDFLTFQTTCSFAKAFVAL